MAKNISLSTIKTFKNKFLRNNKNTASRNALIKNDLANVALNWENFSQINHNFSYGATLSFQVPLGKRFNDECLKAAQTYRKYQEFLLDAKRLEVNLNRAKLCATMLKEGIKFVDEDAVSCRNIVLTTIPNQVIPHTHKLK